MASPVKTVKHNVTDLETHADQRGWLVELLRANELEKPIKQFHVFSIKPGKIRGNHYHSKRIEWLFLVSGRAQLVLEDIKTKERMKFTLSSRNPQVLTVYPLISHAIKNIGKETSYLVAAQTDLYNPETPDQTPYTVI